MSILLTLTQTCDLYAPAGTSAGLLTYGETATSSSVQCRGETHRKQKMQSDGTVVTSDMLLFLPSSATVTRGYKVVLDSISYVIDELDEMRGLAGISHYEAVCRRIP